MSNYKVNFLSFYDLSEEGNPYNHCMIYIKQELKMRDDYKSSGVKLTRQELDDIKDYLKQVSKKSYLILAYETKECIGIGLDTLYRGLEYKRLSKQSYNKFFTFINKTKGLILKSKQN